MFAFALWDRRKRRLLTARARSGGQEAALLRALETARLWFASEPRAILASGQVPRGGGPPGDRPLPALPVRAGPEERLRRRFASCDRRTRLSGAAERSRPAATGSCRTGTAPHRSPTTELLRADPGRASGGDAPAPAKRRARRGAPLGRGRLERRWWRPWRSRPRTRSRRSRSASTSTRSTRPRTPGKSHSGMEPIITSWCSMRRAMELVPRLVWHYGEPFADPSALATFAPERPGEPARDRRAERRRRRRELLRLPAPRPPHPQTVRSSSTTPSAGRTSTSTRRNESKLYSPGVRRPASVDHDWRAVVEEPYFASDSPAPRGAHRRRGRADVPLRTTCS